jgi:chorismate dehydratase
MSLRVARIPYLNSVPFYREVPAGVELLDLPPRQLGQAARAGAVDAGILSMCDIFGIPGLQPLGNLGVAVDGDSHSVLLLSHRKPGDLGGCRVAVTAETSTSLPLLQLLLEDFYGARDVSYERGDAVDGPEAELLIGDAALRVASAAGLVPGRSEYGPDPILLAPGPDQPWRWALDLGAVWCAWQELPFVFAEWVIRDTVAPAECRRIAAALHDSVAWSEAHPMQLAAECEGMAGLDVEAAAAYLEGFTYRIGDRERAAIERFHEKIEPSPRAAERVLKRRVESRRQA